MLQLWGRMSSINVRKVVWAAQELGLDFQRTEAGGAFGVVKTPEYTALNPNAMVPLLQDGDFTLWESNVIVRYLCATHPERQMYPADLHERFDAERWMDWQQTTLNPAGRDAFIQWVRTAPEQRDHALLLHSIAATESLLSMLDAHLAHRPFVAGDRFTMADIPLGCEIHRWRAVPTSPTAPATPHLDRWYQAVSSRPTALGVLDQALT